MSDSDWLFPSLKETNGNTGSDRIEGTYLSILSSKMVMASIPEASSVQSHPSRISRVSKEGVLVSSDRPQQQSVTPLFFLACLLSGVSLAYYAGRFCKEHCFRQGPASSLSPIGEMLREATTRLRQTVLVSSTKKEQSSSIITEEVLFESEAFGQYDDSNVDRTPDDPTAISVMMDMEFVDADFLADKDAVQASMLALIWEASAGRDVAMLSMHCQINVAIHCVAILEDGNHLSVTTVPSQSMLLLDFFAAVEGNVMDMVTLMQKHFDVGSPRVRWNHILRGNRERLARWPTYECDLADLFLDYRKFIFYKTPIGTAKSVYQEIDIWDFVDSRVSHVIGYEQSLVEGTYEHARAELYKPNRVLFLDGVLQSTARGDEAYHEALVHPAMFAHDDPKRVAIIGGGEGATLREVLKHTTVDVCKMIEIDAAMVQAARDFLPALNNCADFGTHDSCFEDDRTDLLCEDAFGWFMQRFGEKKTVQGEETFDLIIMDALDPEDKVDFAIGLYKDLSFWRGLQEALSDDGILVMQLGGSPTIQYYGEQFGLYSNRADLFDTVVKVGFLSLHLYEEAHSDFSHPWSFMIACKTDTCSKNWYANEAEVSRKIHQRILPTKSGKHSLKYFDGSTMQRYQRPTRAWETVYCRADPEPTECRILKGRDGKVVLWRQDLIEQKRLHADMERVVATFRGESVVNGTDAFNTRLHGVSPVRDRHAKLFL
jgi:spermidine synthase